ncbi:MAG: LPS-assembly protein LptD [Chitinispirillaceae bacterium]|nr:LPS-assembly protein LptD [Chitinispirillaceae bacterium]
MQQIREQTLAINKPDALKERVTEYKKRTSADVTKPHPAFLLQALLALVFSLQAQPSDALQSVLTKPSLPGIHPSADSSSGTDKPVKKKQDLTDTVHYEADKIDYDAEAKRLILTGNARIDYQKITLYADTILYLIDQDIFTATGMPQLVESGDTTVGDYMIYNIKTRRGRVNHASTHLSDASFNGNRIVKSKDNELYVDAGDYTTCARIDTPHYCFYGRNIKIIPNDKIISRPVVLNIGEAPVAALPYFIFPIERKRRSGFLTPVWGGHPSGGGYLDNIGYYFAPNDYVDFTLHSRVYEFREFVLNAASSWALKYRLNGSLSARYALNTDFLNRRNEWAINFSHDWNITPDGKTRLSGAGNLLSTKTSRYNFIERYSEDSLELREQSLKANLSFSRQFDRINSRLNLSVDRTHNLRTDMVNDNLPILTFNVPSRPLIPHETTGKNDSLKWFNNIYWGYDARGIMKHTGSASRSDTVKESYHPGMSQSINCSAPQKLFKWITVSPNFSARVSTFLGYKDTAVLRYDTLYDTVQYVTTDTTGKDRFDDYTFIRYEFYSRNQFPEEDSVRVFKHKMRSIPVHNEYPHAVSHVPSWKTGVSVSTNLYGLFPIHILNFAGLRHTFSPSLSYTFTPEQKLEKEFYDAGISYDRGHKRSQQVNFSLGNQFEGKIVKETNEGEKPQEQKFTILSFGLSTGYNFEAERRKWSDLSMNASTGFKNIRLTYNSGFWFYDEMNRLSAPLMHDMSINLSIGTLGAKGMFWGGDLIVLDSLQPDDPVKYANVNKNDWNLSLTPNFTFSMTRSTPTEMFTPTKQYGLNSSASVNITRNWSLQWSSTYNFQANQWVQNSINMACDLECWNMRFQWRPEKLNPGYYFIIHIKKIPEIKWEQRR